MYFERSMGIYRDHCVRTVLSHCRKTTGITNLLYASFLCPVKDDAPLDDDDNDDGEIFALANFMSEDRRSQTMTPVRSTNLSSAIVCLPQQSSLTSLRVRVMWFPDISYLNFFVPRHFVPYTSVTLTLTLILNPVLTPHCNSDTYRNPNTNINWVLVR